MRFQGTFRSRLDSSKLPARAVAYLGNGMAVLSASIAKRIDLDNNSARWEMVVGGGKVKIVCEGWKTNHELCDADAQARFPLGLTGPMAHPTEERKRVTCMSVYLKSLVTREMQAPFSVSLVKESRNGLQRKLKDKDFVRNWKEKNRAGQL